MGLLVFSFSGLSLYAQQDAFRVMSFNIRYDNPNDGENSWANRKSMVGNVIRYHAPKIIGLQEVLYAQLRDLETALPHYKWIGVGRDDGKNAGEFTPVFYDTRRFKLLKHDTFWLSETPDEEGKKGWDAALPRTATWAYFYDKVTGKSFYFFNTHLDHQGTIARLESVKLILKKIAAFTEKKSWVPVVITGDFNSLHKSGPYQWMTHWENPVKMQDAQSDSTARTMGPNYTYIGFEPKFEEGMIIDYIFINEAVDVQFHHILTDQKDGRYPSDHLPVVAEISFK